MGSTSMINPSELDAVRRAIRKFLVIPYDEPVDVVMLAAVVANFATKRQDPVWLVIVAGPGSAKSELTGLLDDWKPVWRLPNRPSPAYFLSAKTGKGSALKRIEEQGKRILVLADMINLISVSRSWRDDLWSQLIGIYDGMYLHETGLTSVPVQYGPVPPESRLGFITTGTSRFYEWQQHVASLGSRFLAYYLPSHKLDWSDHHLLVEIAKMRAEKSHWRKPAKEAVHSFLDRALESIDDLQHVRMNPEDVERIAAAVTLTQRVIGTGSQSDDQGTRLSERAQEITRVIAFLRGSSVVGPQDAIVGIRIALSQMTPSQSKVLTWSLRAENIGEKWDTRALLEFVGSTRRIFVPVLAAMSDVGVIQQFGSSVTGHRYKASGKTVELAKAINAPEIFNRVDHWEEPVYTEPPPTAAGEIDDDSEVVF